MSEFFNLHPALGFLSILGAVSLLWYAITAADNMVANICRLKLWLKEAPPEAPVPLRVVGSGPQEVPCWVVTSDLGRTYVLLTEPSPAMEEAGYIVRKGKLVLT